MLATGHRQNFDTLQQAFCRGDAALLECRLIATGERVPVIVAVNQVAGEFEFVPFALMFDNNPYELLDPPHPDGDFQTDPERPPS